MSDPLFEDEVEIEDLDPPTSRRKWGGIEGTHFSGKTRSWIAGLLALVGLVLLIILGSTIWPAIAPQSRKPTSTPIAGDTQNGIVSINAVDNQTYIVTADGMLQVFRDQDGAFLWRAPASIYVMPLVQHGVVYVWSQDGPNSIVKALQADGGRQIWLKKTALPLFNQLIVDGTQAYARHDFNSLVSVFSAFRASDGQFLWQYKTDTQDVTDFQAIKDKIYLTVRKGNNKDQTELIVLRARDGATLWTYNYTSDELSYGVWEVDNQRLSIMSTRGSIKSLDIETGKIVWSYQPERPTSWTPFAQDQKIYVSGKDGSVKVLNQKDGQELWHYKDDILAFQPDITNGLAYIKTMSGAIDVVTTDNGRRINQLKPLTGTISSSVVYADSSVAYISVWNFQNNSDASLCAFRIQDGTMLWKHKIVQRDIFAEESSGVLLIDEGSDSMVALNKKDGRELWRTRLPSKMPGLIQTFGNKVYLRTSQGNVEVRDPQSGKIVWTYPMRYRGKKLSGAW